MGSNRESSHILNLGARGNQSSLSVKQENPGSGDSVFGGESKNVLRSQLGELIHLNERNLAELHPNRGKFLSVEVVRKMFYLSIQLGLSRSQRMVALELFDRWILAYAISFDSIQHLFTSAERQKMMIRLKTTTALRMCSCIQLASKFEGSAKQVVSLESVRILLERLNEPFKPYQILASEVRVFKALNYNASVLTPLKVIKVVLLLLELDGPKYRQCYKYCSYAVDYVYLQKDSIYTAFSNNLQLKKDIPAISPEAIHGLKNDYILQAAAIIQCIMFVLSPSSESPEKHLSSLEYYTGKTRFYIWHLAYSIATFLFGDE